MSKFLIDSNVTTLNWPRVRWATRASTFALRAPNFPTTHLKSTRSKMVIRTHSFIPLNCPYPIQYDRINLWFNSLFFLLIYSYQVENVCGLHKNHCPDQCFCSSSGNFYCFSVLERSIIVLEFLLQILHWKFELLFNTRQRTVPPVWVEFANPLQSAGVKIWKTSL